MKYLNLKGFVVLLLFLWGFSPQNGQAQVSKASIGWAFANLSGITYYSTQHAFCDAFKTAKRWEKSPAGTGGLDQVYMDANGWVTSYPAGTSGAEALVFTGGGGVYPTGNYVLTWTGGAANGSDIAVTGAGVTLQSENLTSNPKRRVYTVNSTSNNGMTVAITSTNIKNIHLWFPGLEGGDPNGFKNGNPADGPSPFTPWFKETLSIMSAIRFMDWNKTNNSRQQTWSQRKPENFAFFGNMEQDQHAVYTTFGSVPYEYMIALCNELNVDMWVNIPHLADNNYLTQLATLVRDNLKPTLRVWVEYTNEHWNSGFSQHGWLNNNRGSVPNVDQFYAVRSMNAWNIFDNVVGGARVVRLTAGAWAGILNECYKVSGFNAEVAAITGYIGGHDKKFNNGQTPWQYIKANIGSITTTQVIDKCIAECQPQMRTSWNDAVSNAAAHGIPMVTYEAGSHISSLDGAGTSQQIQNFMFALHRDPKFYDYQLMALRDWKNAGGKGYNMFTDVGIWTAFGNWGHKEHYNTPVSQAHRYRAFVTFVNENSTPTTQFTLTTATNGSGSIALNPPGGTYNSGQVVAATATPAAGWKFDNWSGAATGTTNPVNITMNANKTLTANFSLINPNSEIITLQGEDETSSTGGNDDSAQAGYTGTGYFDMAGNGTSVDYTFPAQGGTYSLALRYANGSTANRACSIIVNSAAGVPQNFAPTGSWTTWNEVTHTVTLTTTNTIRILVTGTGGPNLDRLVLTKQGNPTTQYTLTTTTSGQGTISLNPPGGTYNDGTIVQATASPVAGWQFTGWSGAATGTTNPVSITMNANKSLTATFTQVPVQQFTLTVNIIGQGSVALSPPGGTYNNGTVVQATATPAVGWQVAGWSGAATGTANPISVTMNANKTLTVTFVLIDPNPETITLQAEDETGKSGGNDDDAQAGFTGTGYFDMAGTGSWVEYTFTAQGGAYNLAIRYANGSTGNRACNVIVTTSNGSASTPNNFVPTGSWTTWLESPMTVTLTPGSNTIRIQVTGSGGPNVDRLVLTKQAAGGGGARLSSGSTQQENEATYVFPNPSTGTVQIQGVLPPFTVHISGMTTRQLIKSVYSEDGTVDVSDLAAGMYLLQVKGRMIKMVKK